jgi:cob(I)alamin adenosyltransferase
MNDNLHNPQFDELGYIQVYTGLGKGKTTASLGLILRALGRGWSVLLVMFTKGGNDYGELHSFAKLSPNIKNKFKIVNAGLDRIVYQKNKNEKDKEEVQRGWEIAKKAIQNNEFQLVVLDEANIAIDLGLIDLKEMLEVLKNKPKTMEIVLTGRGARQEIIDIAHLVSEITPIKHYWNIGVSAREGVEY